MVGLSLLWLFGERGRPLRPSTWRMLRETDVRSLISLNVLNGYVYGRWTNQYLSMLINRINPRLGPAAWRWTTNRYHAKVITHEEARAIITLDHDIAKRDLEQVIPYATARDLVLKGPPDVAVYECACRHARSNPCQPTQVCMVVGQPFVDFILEHNPQSSRRLTQMEALELLKAEHERGHLHSAWFKDALLNRFYAICNCCKCCCVGVEAMTKYGQPLLASSGHVAQIDQELCSGCVNCVDACLFGALSMTDSLVARDWDKCMGCGVCVDKCPTGAISLARDERKGLPLDVKVLV